jgi:hypothetical protein
MSATQQAKPDFGPAIDRLRAIAIASSDALLTEGPVQPDHKLIDLCVEIAHGRKMVEAAAQRERELPAAAFMCKTPAETVALEKAREGRRSAEKNYSAMLRAAAKIKATTAAGIFAKALAVRSSKSGAADLGVSLAQDLLDCPGLRASLWPASEAPMSEGGD